MGDDVDDGGQKEDDLIRFDDTYVVYGDTAYEGQHDANDTNLDHEMMYQGEYGLNPEMMADGTFDHSQEVHPMFENLPERLPSYRENMDTAYGYGEENQGYASQGYDPGYHPQDDQQMHQGYPSQGYDPGYHPQDDQQMHQGYPSQGYDTGYHPQEGQQLTHGYEGQMSDPYGQQGPMYQDGYGAAMGGHGQDPHMGGYQENYSEMPTHPMFSNLPPEMPSYETQHVQHTLPGKFY